MVQVVMHHAGSECAALVLCFYTMTTSNDWCTAILG
jgi:hypothetical protein